MKNNPIRIIALFLSVLMLLAGCANAQNDASTTGKPDLSSEASATAADITEEEITEAVQTESAHTETNAATDIPTDKRTEPISTETDKATEKQTETDAPQTEPATEIKTEPVTEKQTEKATERVTEPVTERQTEPVTEKQTEPVTEKVTDPVTEPVTEPVTDEPEPVPTVLPDMPKSSSSLSYDFALTLLNFAGVSNESGMVSRLKAAGLTHVLSMNFTKAPNDASHTCAYVVGKCVRNGKEVYVVAVRGTSGGEWLSNFDFAPSHDNETQYAENFLYCAEDIFEHIKGYLNASSDSQIVVCGHSRGAAAANLLGVLLDREYGKERVYAYTFATPYTVRGAAAEIEYDNIFNFINPDDIVTYIPPSEYGFKRAGRDIILPSGGENADVIKALSDITKVVPDIRSYYENRYSLTGPGLSEDGSTVYELFVNTITGFVDGTYDIEIPMIMPTSDLYPVMQLFYKFYKIKTMMAIRNAHEPDTYLALINQIR
ncbi:MAG: hypothetical protein II135_02680 [Clostridia bacterium]|nr:hypothetical protein [Clostridia bacterium]